MIYDFETIQKAIEKAEMENQNCLFPSEEHFNRAPIAFTQNPKSKPRHQLQPVPSPTNNTGDLDSDDEENSLPQASNDSAANDPLIPNAAPEETPKKKPLTPSHQEAINYGLSLFKFVNRDEDGTEIFKAATLFRKTNFTYTPPALLKTATNDSMAAEGMVAMAAAKGWAPIQATGTPEFQSAIFLHAARMGLEMSGYTPTPEDLKKLDQSNLPIPAWATTNSIEIAKTKIINKDLSAAPPSFSPEAKAAPVSDKKADTISTLIAHGPAPFENDKKNTASYYVTLQDQNGKERTVWGIDLERAISESRAQIGDPISVVHVGKKPVTVMEKEFDAAGKLIGSKPVETIRNSWDVQLANEPKLKKAPPSAAKPTKIHSPSPGM